MTPEERQLITGLFDRMRGFALAEKDADAEALINEGMASVRDAPYMLVQSVLVQEHALQEADNRIKALDDQVRALQNAGRQHPADPGSFLGGLFGSGRPATEPDRGYSVPVVGARATPSVYDGRSALTPLPSAAQPAQPGTGGFLRTAMATAAGVAGGMLVAGAIGSLLGNSAHASPTAAQHTPDAAGAASDTGAADTGAADTGAAAKETAQPQDATANPDVWEDAHQDAADSDDGWFGGDGGDFDI